MCTYPFAKKALTLHLARGESRERYFDCNLMQRKVLASSHQHLVAEAPDADIRGFFDAIDHGWLMKVVEHRTLHPYPEQRLRVMT